ncbi:MAG: enoyl-CoA hydratase [Nocardioidaceae bacterium]|nr:enoyl-CoA hydratase [Nocardioidaceae bacterium]
MTTYETIRVEHEGPVTWIVLNRPDHLNALSDVLQDELMTALTELETSGGSVIVLRGEGRCFSAGYDIQPDNEEVAGTGGRGIIEERDRLLGNLERFLRLWDHPKPTIACVHGYCLAGATQLAGLCDLTIVSRSAVIGEASMPIGGGYLEPFWSTFMGPKRAKQMTFTPGGRIDGETAAAWGWANYAVDDDALIDDVRALATRIARIHPDVLKVRKYSVNRQFESTGFRAHILAGAETDALLHFADPVRDLMFDIKNLGLKAAMAKFEGEGAPS